MSPEHNITPRENSTREQETHALFISGGMGTYSGIRGIEAGLKEKYKPENVTVFNSILSTDPQNPKRFEDMADVVTDNIGKGIKVHVIAHSLGASEARKMTKQIRRKDSGFFNNPNNTSKLHITLVSPASIKSLAGPFSFLYKTWQFAREHADLPISKKETIYRGIDSLTAFPPQDIPHEELALAMRGAFDKLSQHREEITVVKFTPEDTYNNKLTTELTTNQQEDLKNLDTKLKSAVESKNHVDLHNLIKERGKLLRQPLAKVFEGKLEDADEETLESIEEATKATMGGYIALLNTTIGAMVNLPLKEMERLQTKGVQVDFIVPEYDIWKSTEETIKFYGSLEEAKENIVLAERGTHAYPALQPKLFSNTVFDLHSKKIV